MKITRRRFPLRLLCLTETCKDLAAAEWFDTEVDTFLPTLSKVEIISDSQGTKFFKKRYVFCSFYEN